MEESVQRALIRRLHAFDSSREGLQLTWEAHFWPRDNCWVPLGKV